MLLYGVTESEEWAKLYSWKERASGLHDFVPDFHRLQIERWIWDRRGSLVGRVMDVGVENRRDWIGDGYFTFGQHGCDVIGDLLALPFRDESIDSVILTEVLEHCADPIRAIAEIHRVMKPGALLLVTSPFLWPWHGTSEYPDYWRFTDQAWGLMLGEFADVKLTRCGWTVEGEQGYDMMRRFECMGFRESTRASTGYLAEAIK